MAKATADIILTGDHFASIEKAVEEGRGVFDNLTKVIVWRFPCNFGEALLLLGAIMVGATLPALPAQLLWINTMTAVIMGFALIFEPREDDLMQRPPRDPQKPIVDFELFMRTCLMSVIVLVGCFGLFIWAMDVGGGGADSGVELYCDGGGVLPLCLPESGVGGVGGVGGGV